MSLNTPDQRAADAVPWRSNRNVWVAVGLSAAGLIPLFGFLFGVAGCVCALFVALGHGYSIRQRRVAVAAFLLGASLAAFWWWLTAYAWI